MKSSEFQKWVEQQSGITTAAALLNESYQLVQYWLRKGIPPTRCHDVERITGISRYELRPDIFGDAPDLSA